ncbi:hypothetical protein GCM10017673_38310 [Streptosporangium violaceochromogenes]|nr:hypothetical protein GCM10017673_38310 [Streptosporangium violaceochromogenes]
MGAGVVDEEPTRGELARSMSRLEGMIGELKADIKMFAATWSAQAAAGSVLALRVEALEAWKVDITREFDLAEKRLDQAEKELFARQDAYERENERRRQVSGRVSIGIAAVGMVVAIVGTWLKAG